jgi:hypothetical protein
MIWDLLFSVNVLELFEQHLQVTLTITLLSS